MGRKLERFSVENHIDMSNDIRESFKLLEKWQEKIWKSHGVNHKSSKCLDKAIRYIRNDIRNIMDAGWHNNPDIIGRSPYYNSEYKEYGDNE